MDPPMPSGSRISRQITGACQLSAQNQVKILTKLDQNLTDFGRNGQKWR